MIACVINAVLVLLGSAVGLLFKSKIKESWSKAIMIALGLCVLLIGVSGASGYSVSSLANFRF